MVVLPRLIAAAAFSVVLPSCALPLVINGAPTGNRSPVLSALTPNPASTVQPGQAITFLGVANDPDGDPVQFNWAATGGALSANSGQVVSWTPPEKPGAYSVTLIVTDGKGGVVTGTVNLTVSSEATVISSPVIQVPAPPSPPLGDTQQTSPPPEAPGGNASASASPAGDPDLVQFSGYDIPRGEVKVKRSVILQRRGVVPEQVDMYAVSAEDHVEDKTPTTIFLRTVVHFFPVGSKDGWAFGAPKPGPNGVLRTTERWYWGERDWAPRGEKLSAVIHLKSFDGTYEKKYPALTNTLIKIEDTPIYKPLFMKAELTSKIIEYSQPFVLAPGEMTLRGKHIPVQVDVVVAEDNYVRR